MRNNRHDIHRKTVSHPTRPGTLRAPDSLCISLSLSEWLPRRYFRQNDRIHSSSEGGWLKAKVPQDFPPARFARRISFVFPDCLRRTPAKSEYASGRIAKALFRAGIQKKQSDFRKVQSAPEHLAFRAGLQRISAVLAKRGVLSQEEVSC